MNKAIIIILSLILSACACKPIYIPAEAPKCVIPSEPHYPTQTLKNTDKNDYQKIAKTLVQTLKMKDDYIKEIKIRCG